MNGLKNIIVTGSNQGIGLGIVQKLASLGTWNIILAVRNIHAGEEARNHIVHQYPQASLNVQKLDLADSASINDFVSTIKQKYGKISILVNNAGAAVHGDAFDSEVVKFTFKTNIYGTIELTEKIISLIEDKGKIITLGSTAGVMTFKRITSESIKNRFTKEDITKEELFALAQEFEDGVANGNYAELGWPKWSYGVSKLVINLYHKVLAKNAEIVSRGIQVNVCCPGYVKTNMTSGKGHLTVEQGAITPVFLIERPFEVDHATQGGLFYECKLISFFGNE